VRKGRGFPHYDEEFNLSIEVGKLIILSFIGGMMLIILWCL
jgi:hypothetical protein